MLREVITLIEKLQSDDADFTAQNSAPEPLSATRVDALHGTFAAKGAGDHQRSVPRLSSPVDFNAVSLL